MLLTILQITENADYNYSNYSLEIKTKKLAMDQKN